MENIMINKNWSKNVGGEIGGCADNFHTKIVEFSNLIDDISNAWQGEDVEKYLNVLREKYISGLNELEKIIADYGKYLQEVSGAYELLDESFANKKIG